MLNQYTMTQVHVALQYGGFLPEDFHVNELPEKLSIIYRAVPKYRFEAAFESDVRSPIPALATLQHLSAVTSATRKEEGVPEPIAIWVNPGELRQEDQFRVKSASSLISAVRGWLERINLELEAVPQFRMLSVWKNGFEVELNKLMEGFQVAAGEMFTQEEGQAFKAQLDDLEKRVAEQLKAAAHDAEELRSRVSDLHQTVEYLKVQVDRLDKPGVIRTVCSRLLRFVQKEENRKLLKDGFDATVALSKLLDKGN